MEYRDLTPFYDVTEAISYAILELRKILAKCGFELNVSSAEKSQLSKYMPYSIHETSSAGVYILVNRHYKPLGFENIDWVNYDDFQSLHISLTKDELYQVTNSTYEAVLWKGDNSPFNNRENTNLYLQKLVKLQGFA